MTERMDPRLAALARELGLSRVELMRGFEDLLAEPKPKPVPTGYVAERRRAASEKRRARAERKVKPYDEAARSIMFRFWIESSIEFGVRIPDDVWAEMQAGTVAEKREMLEVVARAEARAAARARRQARSRQQDSPERVYRP